MNLLPKREQVKDSDATGKPCWEFLSCDKVLCPAHNSKGEDCWLVPRTHTDDYIGEDFFQRLATCLSCAYFKKRGGKFPGGWNQFISFQLQRYNVKVLERLYLKEESFVNILNRIPDGVFTTDHEWRITFFNPAAERITGFSASDAVGMYCKDVFKNPICETACALKQAAASRKDILNHESVITTIDGMEVPIICSTSVFRDPSGRVTGGLEIFKDISEVRWLREQMDAREKKYARIFEGSHDMIYRTNQQGDLLDVNPAGVRMLGYNSKKEMLGIDSARRLYKRARDRDRFVDLINRDGYVKNYEVDFAKRDGTPVHVLISSRRYENHENGDVEYEGIIKDITQRKQMEETLKQRNWEISILNSIAVSFNRTMDLDHILMVTLAQVLNVLRLRRGAIFLIDREEKKAKLQVKFGLSDEDASGTNMVLFKDTLLMKKLINEDVELRPTASFPPFRVDYRPSKEMPVVWMLCFLITFKGKAVGFFGFETPAFREFNREEISLLGSLGNFVGGAIVNAQLMEASRLHRRELRKLTQKLFQSQEDERRRIARELHDEAGQALTAIKLGLDRLDETIGFTGNKLKEEVDIFRRGGTGTKSAEILSDRLFQKLDSAEKGFKTDLRDIRQMIARTSAEIRRLSYRLHPTLLTDLGLEPALRLYFKEVSDNSHLDIEFRMVGFDSRVDMDTETALYRFGQESLTNTLKHSGAETFKLSIIKSYPRIIFLAEDDGIGFDGNITGNDRHTLGLLGMRERVSLLGGKFQLSGRPEKGVRIRIEIPLPEGDHHG